MLNYVSVAQPYTAATIHNVDKYNYAHYVSGVSHDMVLFHSHTNKIRYAFVDHIWAGQEYFSMCVRLWSNSHCFSTKLNFTFYIKHKECAF